MVIWLVGKRKEESLGGMARSLGCISVLGIRRELAPPNSNANASSSLALALWESQDGAKDHLWWSSSSQAEWFRKAELVGMCSRGRSEEHPHWHGSTCADADPNRSQGDHPFRYPSKADDISTSQESRTQQMVCMTACVIGYTPQPHLGPIFYLSKTPPWNICGGCVGKTWGKKYI